MDKEEQEIYENIIMPLQEEETNETSKALIDIGTMPQTAAEIYSYVKDALVAKASPLKEQSLELHCRIEAELPHRWENWTNDDIILATAYYDMLTAHMQLITNKTRMTEFDDLRDKAHKLKTGIIDAIKDVIGPLAEDKKALTTKIRRWRTAEEEKAKAEALRLTRLAQQQEDERRLQEALEIEAEANRLRQAGNVEAAEGLFHEAEAIIEEKPFIPPPVMQNNIPKGGPKKQKFWKFRVNLMLLIKGIIAGRVPISAVLANEVLIGNQVRKLKTELKWDGIEVWPE